MNITLFGSAFNPPHLGHALVIQDFLEAGLTNELWLLPNIKHSFGKHMAAPEHRLAMTQLFLDYLNQSLPSTTSKSNPGIVNPGIEPGNTSNQSYSNSIIRVCPIEIDLNLSGQTFDTLQALKTNTQYLNQKSLLPTASTLTPKFSFLMGSDQLPTFNNWGRYQQLLQNMHFYIYPRAGYNDRPLRPNMELFTTDHQTITNLSSTLIRHKLSSNRNISLLLPPDIITYIRTKHLYTSV